jgi:hypothetical protein
VTAGCDDLEAALRGEDPDLLAAFARHAETCPACRDELRLWNAISAAAPALRKEWPSPGLDARLREGLRRESRPRPRLAPAAWLSLAAAAALFAAVLARPFLGPRPTAPEGNAPTSAAIPAPAIDETQRLLTERALAEVEKTEAAYVRSIDGLATVAAPRLAETASPLLVNYREKLLVLDAAIADCRAQIERNRFNAHLRLELLAVYREKQRTLEALLREDPNVS